MLHRYDSLLFLNQKGFVNLYSLVQYRPLDSAMPTRYSRHYYDLIMMAKNEVKDDALADLELLKNVVEFKQKFYPRTWAKYEEAIPGTLKLLPPEFRLDSLEKDYKAMQNMIFDKYISFEEIIDILRDLKEGINIKMID